MAAGRAERDTDADWRELGETQPFWGVLTHPDYRTENLTAANVEAFYETGQDYIAEIVRRLEALTGVRPSGRALDFGCGTGRLTEAMCAYAETVGYDIAPGMLEQARKRNGRGVYADALPEGPFDWINSFIVLQHIPTSRGMAIIEDLLARLAPGGLLSLQLTVWREAEHMAPEAPKGWRRLVRALLNRPLPVEPVRGTIVMYDYDLSSVVRLLNRAGVTEMMLISTDHGGHHGVIMLGRRQEAAGGGI